MIYGGKFTRQLLSIHMQIPPIETICRGLTNNVNIFCTKVAPVPDHKAVIVVFEANECIRGKGYWKINNSVLKDYSYKKSIIEIFKQTINEYKDIATKRNMWDLCKIRFKEFSIKYCIEKNEEQ